MNLSSSSLYLPLILETLWFVQLIHPGSIPQNHKFAQPVPVFFGQGICFFLNS
jgi:hypothetical protein